MRYEIELTTGSKYQVEEDATLQQISELVSNKKAILVFTEHIFRAEKIIAVRKLDKYKLEVNLAVDSSLEINQKVNEAIEKATLAMSEVDRLATKQNELEHETRKKLIEYDCDYYKYDAENFGKDDDKPHWMVKALEKGILKTENVLVDVLGTEYKCVHTLFFCSPYNFDRIVENGDYILRGMTGQLYLCDSDTFEKYYGID